MKRCLLGLLVCLPLCVSAKMSMEEYARSLHVDFKTSMGPRHVRFNAWSQDDDKWWAFLQELYERNNFSKITVHKEPLIPKIIHHIWVCGPLPDRYLPYIETWKKFHPDWIHLLWTDEKVAEIKLDNQHLYDKATNPAMKSDILRYELIYRYGGVYVDIDFECLAPFDVLHHCYEFYTGVSHVGAVEVAPALIGGRPGHPIVAECIQKMNDFKPGRKTPHQVMNITGNGHYSRMFMKIAPRCEGPVIALPASYFYPLPNSITGLKKQEDIKEWLHPESFAVHYFACSWVHK